nr:hypothetical protein [uncultured bacterium]AIA14005.1 Unknown Function [uncultured bacterium]
MKQKTLVKKLSKTTKRSKAQPTGLHHHAKRLFHMTPKFVHGMMAGAFIGVVIVLSLRNAVPASALSIISPRDCDTNAVINCGALSTTELQQRYSYAGVAAIYNSFGISAQDIANVGTTAAAGQVYKDGTVTVGGVTVATNAITAGRNNIAGSTKVVSGGVTLYKRPPSVSFRVNSIAAFVVMQNGQFKFAILGACGNPVNATAVPKATPPPPPVTPPPVVETPPVTEVVATPSTQTPPSTPTAIVAVSTPTSLPQTGPGAVMIVALLSVIGGYLFHITHRHIRRRRGTHPI